MMGAVTQDLSPQAPPSRLWAVAYGSLLVTLMLPALYRLKRVEKRSLWRGIGVSASTCALSGLAASVVDATRLSRLGRADAEYYWEHSSQWESDIAQGHGWRSKLRSTAVLDATRKRLIAEENPRGFTWRMTTPKGQVHFLVGTCHAATTAMVEQPDLQAAFDACDILITEIGSELLQHQQRARRMARTVGMEHHLDLELSKRAKELGKELLGLDSSADIAQALRGTLRESLQLSALEAKVLHQRVIKKWQQGDERIHEIAVKKLPLTARACHLRTANWLKGCKELGGLGLIRFLETTTETCSVMVGCGHCLGERGLVSALEKAGFTVQRMGMSR